MNQPKFFVGIKQGDGKLKILFTSAEIDRRISELASEIDRDAGGGEVVLLGVLTGAFLFLADLSRKIKSPCLVDFVRLSSYGGGTSSCGEVTASLGHKLPLAGKDVIVVEEIVDSGRTLRYLLDELEKCGAKSVRVCALVDKSGRREVEVPVHYAGFVIEDGFLVGFGMDFAESMRNLPYIAVMDEH